MEQINKLLKENRLAWDCIFAFRKADRAIKNKEGIEIKKGGLTPPQFGVLETLHSKGNLTVSELIENTLATAGNMTVIIKNMEKDGWIYRKHDPDDKRSHIICITEEGKKLVEAILPEHIRNIASIFSILDDEEKHIFIKILNKFENLLLI